MNLPLQKSLPADFPLPYTGNKKENKHDLIQAKISIKLV